MSENNRKLFHLFPTALLECRVPDREELNDKLLVEIDALRRDTPNGRPATWSCDVYTTITNNFLLHQQPGFSRLAQRFMEALSQYADAMRYSLVHNKIIIDMCWLNVYGRNHSQERHAHTNYVMAGIYYVKAPPGCSNLIVHSPKSDIMIRPKVRRDTDANRTFVKIDPEPGMMLIFDGHLLHGVTASTIDEERISIAVNANLVAK